jgi:hypothetical protein
VRKIGILSAVTLVSALTFGFAPAQAACPDHGGNCADAPGHSQHSLDAPAPLLGAGIPGLAIGLGYGAYWLVRRRKAS